MSSINAKELTSLDISRGKDSKIKNVLLNGVNPDVDTATVPEDLIKWGGVYQGFNPTTEDILSIVSNSVNDTLLGTHAQKITIFGLDINYNEISEVVELNGVTPVLTVKSFFRVNNPLAVTQAGSSNTNDGIIIITHAENNDEMGQILPEDSVMSALYATVPCNKNFYITLINIFLNDANLTFATLHFHLVSPTGIISKSLPISVAQAGGQSILPVNFRKIQAKSSFLLVVDNVSSNGSNLSAYINYTEVTD